MVQDIECDAEKSELFLPFISGSISFHLGPASRRNDREGSEKSPGLHVCLPA